MDIAGVLAQKEEYPRDLPVIIVEAFNEPSNSSRTLSTLRTIGMSQIEFLDHVWKTPDVSKNSRCSIGLQGFNSWGPLLKSNREDIEYLGKISRKEMILDPLL